MGMEIPTHVLVRHSNSDLETACEFAEAGQLKLNGKYLVCFFTSGPEAIRAQTAGIKMADA